jgi:hypothetical protein
MHRAAPCKPAQSVPQREAIDSKTKSALAAGAERPAGLATDECSPIRFRATFVRRCLHSTRASYIRLRIR